MTIALGMLAKNGIVIAADTQETYAGVLKVFQGKITTVLNDDLGKRKPTGAFVISGAGSSGQVDALTQELCESFSKTAPTKMAQAEQDVRVRVNAFQKEHIVPFSGLPEYDRPMCSMVMGAAVNGTHRLWVTDKSVVKSCGFGAVGIGAAHANLLLGRLWDANESVKGASVLAAYVLSYVKQCVEGCGNATQIMNIEGNQAYVMQPKRLEVLERQFDEYAEVETRLLRHVLGLTKPSVVDIKQLIRQIEKSSEAITRVLEWFPKVSKEERRKAPMSRWTHDD